MAITTSTSTQTTTTTMKIVLIKTILRRSDYNYTEKKLNIPKKEERISIFISYLEIKLPNQIEI